MSIDLYPKVCNLCGGNVRYTSNAEVYHGRTYGSAFCYLCTNCGAYVGTHKPWPKKALGILADAQMRKGKMFCHQLFDPLWKNAKKRSSRRKRLYAWLAGEMGIPIDECHFGYFSLEQLRQAYRILLSVQDKEIHFKPSGDIYFE